VFKLNVKEQLTSNSQAIP